MAAIDIVSAEYVQMPEEKPGLFPGRPWVVYYEGSIREDGRKAKRGMISFETEREAALWAFRVCPANGLPETAGVDPSVQ